MVWIAFAILTGVAVLAALWPLARARRIQPQALTDIDLYEAELARIGREVDRGLLSAVDGEAMTAEAARRLIRAHDGQVAPESQSSTRIRIAAVLAIVVIPLVTLTVYDKTGSPDFSDMPLDARLNAVPDQMDFAAALARMEMHLASHPDDAQAQQIIAPIYVKLGRYDDAAKSFRMLVQLLGDEPAIQMALGSTLIRAENGKVSPEARAAFEAALAKDADLPEARFYIGLAQDQAGDSAAAVGTWSELLRLSPPGAPWLTEVQNRIVAAGGKIPATSEPNLGDNSMVIRAIVARLADRLEQNGDDLDGWLRLLRSYTVLHETEKAQDALTRARAQFSGNSNAIQKIDALVLELGMTKP